MRLLVCGGRDFTNYGFICEVLDAIHKITPVTVLIHGNARGADELGGAWATGRGVKVWPVPANWKRDGRRAGPLRNQRMLGLNPELVVAFPGGRGTADMVRRAKAAGIEVIESEE